MGMVDKEKMIFIYIKNPRSEATSGIIRESNYPGPRQLH